MSHSYEQLLHSKTQLLTHQNRQCIRFARVTSEHEYKDVLLLRKRIYSKNVPYMLNQLNESGSDNFDKYSYIYAAYFKDKIIASTRLTPYPFETANFIDEDKLAHFLGQYWKENYLEWSRLLVDSSFKIPSISKTLTVYAGLDVLLTTKYTGYFGYTRPHVRKVFSRFKLEKDTLEFSIPERGNHSYIMLKGCFIKEFEHYYQKQILSMKENCLLQTNTKMKEEFI